MKKRRGKYSGWESGWKWCKRLFLLAVSVFVLSPLNGQANNQSVSLNVKKASLASVIEDIHRQINYEFIFNAEDVRFMQGITLSVKEIGLREALDIILKNTGLEYVINHQTVVLKKKAVPAQQVESLHLKGYVMDNRKNPLPGVTVKLANVMVGTSTNYNGYFSFHVPVKSGVLEFSNIGFSTKTIKFTEATDTIRVVLEEMISEMEEVVVTGYQKVDKRRSTSAITSVKASDVLVPGMTSIDQALEGRIPELMLMANSGEVGATPRIRVRGTSTLLGNREPLWVLDGFIMHDPGE